MTVVFRILLQQSEIDSLTIRVMDLQRKLEKSTLELKDTKRDFAEKMALHQEAEALHRAHAGSKIVQPVMRFSPIKSVQVTSSLTIY